MAVLTRITDFIPSTLIESQEVDDEFNQLVNLLSGVSTNKDTLLKYSNATDPVLRVDQLGAGVIQQWLQNGSVKSRINNDGSLESISGPVIAASQLIAAPVTIDGATDIAMKANGQIVGYPRTLHFNTTSTTSTGAGPDDLHSYTLPAGMLAAAGDFLEIIQAGSFATDDDNKAVRTLFAGQAVSTTGSIDIDGLGWLFHTYIVRITDTTVRASFSQIWGYTDVNSANAVNASALGSLVRSESKVLTVADLDTNTSVVLTQATGVNAGDVDQLLTLVRLTQMT